MTLARDLNLVAGMESSSFRRSLGFYRHDKAGAAAQRWCARVGVGGRGRAWAGVLSAYLHDRVTELIYVIYTRLAVSDLHL